MARITPAQAADKYATRTATASADYQRGVEQMTQSPTAKAATKLQKAAQNYQASIQSGRMAAALNAVSLQDFKNAVVTKGVSRYAQGTSAAKDKMVRIMTKLFQAQDAIVQRANAMPDVTLQDRLAKANLVATEMAKLKGTFK